MAEKTLTCECGEAFARDEFDRWDRHVCPVRDDEGQVRRCDECSEPVRAGETCNHGGYR